MKFSKNLLVWLYKSFFERKKEDFKVIILCIVAAATFWFFIAMNKHYNTAKITYPIQVNYDKNTFIPVADLPPKIELNVAGQGWDLLKKTFWFNIKPIELQPANLPKNRYLTSSFLMSVVSGQLKDIKINYIMNDTIHLYFDYRVKKKIAVGVDSAAISLAYNFRIVSPIRIDPDSVEFDGPAASINSLPGRIQLNIPDKKIDDDFETEIPIQYELTSVEEVLVSFEVALFVQENRNAILHLVNFPESSSAWIENDTISISYFTNKKNKERAKEDDFEIVLDYAALDLTDTTIVPTLLKKPGYVTDLTLSPQVVKIYYKMK